MNTLYLVCFVLGLVLSLLSLFSGGGRLHIGHVHFHGGHFHSGPAHATGTHLPAVNGFTLAAFLCWFGGAGYLLDNYSAVVTPLILLLAVLAGLAASSAIYGLIFKLLLPHERVLSAEETRMDGVVARISDEIRAQDGIGEILFSQNGTRRSAAARSESGQCIPRDTEVVVLRYSKGIAWVSPIADLLTEQIPRQKFEPSPRLPS
jgi:hypothetical protein